MALKLNGEEHYVTVGENQLYIPPETAWIDNNGVVILMNFVIEGTRGYVDEEMLLQLLPNHTFITDLAEQSAQIFMEQGIKVASDHFYTPQQPGKPLTNKQVIINALVKPPGVDLVKFGLSKSISFIFDKTIPKAYFNARAVNFGHGRPSPIIKGTIRLEE